jgi:hypothetical protein
VGVKLLLPTFTLVDGGGFCVFPLPPPGGDVGVESPPPPPQPDSSSPAAKTASTRFTLMCIIFSSGSRYDWLVLADSRLAIADPAMKEGRTTDCAG